MNTKDMKFNNDNSLGSVHCERKSSSEIMHFTYLSADARLFTCRASHHNNPRGHLAASPLSSVSFESFELIHRAQTEVSGSTARNYAAIRGEILPNT